MHSVDPGWQFAASVDTANRRGKAALTAFGNALLADKPHPRCGPPPIRRGSFQTIIDHMASTATNGANAEAPSRRSLFALSAALAATVLTGALAVAGLARHVPAAPTAPQIGQTITPAATAQPARVEPGG